MTEVEVVPRSGSDPVAFPRAEVPITLMGEPDGPWEYHPELGLEVPTYIDPRTDLIPPGCPKSYKRLSHHIPFKMRGDYKPQWLPPDYYHQYGKTLKTNLNEYVMCAAKNKEGGDCQHKAVNRWPYCRTHGGALHPADKRLSSKNLSIQNVSQDKLNGLDRVQQFMAGVLTVEDLDDDEIVGQYVRNDEGRPIANKTIATNFHREMTAELVRRMHRLMQMKLPNMIKAMTDIAESDWVEPSDRIRAAIWVSERVMGKTPDVIIHGGTDKPYESILSGIEGGSREEYRRQITSQRIGETTLDVDVVGNDDEDVDEDEEDFVDDEIDPSHLNIHEVASLEKVTTVDEAKRVIRKIKKAKARRYAARAQGILTGEIPWLLEFKNVKNESSKEFVVKIYAPEAQTKTVVDRILTEQRLERSIDAQAQDDEAIYRTRQDTPDTAD